MGDVAARPVVGAADADDGLERLLRGCAAQDAQARRELEALYGTRLRSMLARRIRQPELVEPAMQAALDEICARAGEHDPEHELAEDWLFGRVRALAAGQGLADTAAARGAWVTAEPRHAEVARDDDEDVLTEAPAPGAAAQAATACDRNGLHHGRCPWPGRRRRRALDLSAARPRAGNRPHTLAGGCSTSDLRPR